MNSNTDLSNSHLFSVHILRLILRVDWGEQTWPCKFLFRSRVRHTLDQERLNLHPHCALIVGFRQWMDCGCTNHYLVFMYGYVLSE